MFRHYLYCQYLFAVLINYVKNEKAAGFVKTAFLLPYSITSVIASCLWMFLYMDRSGFINVFLKAFGLKGEKFLGSTSQAMVCIASCFDMDQSGL